MKILITTDLYTTETNGVVTSVKNLRKGLEELGHEVKILTFSENRKSRKEQGVYYIKSISLEFVYPNIRMPSKFNHPFVKELIEWNPDVIHSQCEIFSYSFAKKISKKTGAPIVHTYHTMCEDYVGYVIPFKRLGRWIVKKFMKIRLKKSKSLIVPTKKVETSLLSYNVEQPIYVIPSGIDLSQHKQRITKEERETKKQELGILANSKTLVYLGRLGFEKNLNEIIDFFNQLIDLYPNLYLLVVGGGPAEKSLKEQAKTLIDSGRVIFTGMVNPKDVHRYYQLGDIFVSASTTETQGLTYVEAMANELPLLCKYDNCLEGVLLNGENGFCFTNQQEFCEGLKTLLLNDSFYLSAKNKSSEIANLYSTPTFATSVLQVYTNAINDKN